MPCFYNADQSKVLNRSAVEEIIRPLLFRTAEYCRYAGPEADLEYHLI